MVAKREFTKEEALRALMRAVDVKGEPPVTDDYSLALGRSWATPDAALRKGEVEGLRAGSLSKLVENLGFTRGYFKGFILGGGALILQADEIYSAVPAFRAAHGEFPDIKHTAPLYRDINPRMVAYAFQKNQLRGWEKYMPGQTRPLCLKHFMVASRLAVMNDDFTLKEPEQEELPGRFLAAALGAARHIPHAGLRVAALKQLMSFLKQPENSINPYALYAPAIEAPA